MELNQNSEKRLLLQTGLMKFIIDSVYNHFDIDQNEHILNVRTSDFIIPKQISIYLIKTNVPSITNSDIAKQFNFKNHSSCIHAYRKIKGYLAYDKNLNNSITMLQEKVSEYLQAQMNGTDTKLVNNRFNEKVEYLRIALELNNIVASYSDCCMIYETFKKICEVKSDFSISDIVKIKNEVLINSINNIY